MNATLGSATIKAVIFDCDGTLVDSESAHYLAFKYALQELGHDLLDQDYLQYVGKSDPLVARKLAEVTAIDDADLILQKKHAHYRKLCETHLPPIEATVNFLKNLAKEKSRLGIKLGVCSAAKKESILTHLQHLGISDLLDIVLSGEDDLQDYSDPEGVNKPKPYIYLQAMKRLNVLPGECVVIEDSIPGITAGVSAGCLTIAVPNDYTRCQNLSHAHLKVESFANMSIENFYHLLYTTWLNFSHSN